MRYQQDPSQNELFDFYEQILWPIAYRRLTSGWQRLFRTAILRLMPVGRLAEHFDSAFGRPTKELYSIAALLFVMEFRDWTHQEAADALNIQRRPAVCVELASSWTAPLRGLSLL